MKYICVQSEKTQEYYIFLFDRKINHDAMNESINRMRFQAHGNWCRHDMKAVSAGLVDGSMSCHGHSETMGLKSRPEDTAILQKQLKTTS